MENSSQTDIVSSFLPSSYLPTLTMFCEKFLSVATNQTTFFKSQQLTPPYIRELFAKYNLTSRLPTTAPECVRELSRLINNTNDVDLLNAASHSTYTVQDRSRSLLVFIFLIAFVSILSVIGNLCLVKVLYLKRFRLTQTDRIVLCLALSELSLVLIDSPTEVYRFCTYSFSLTWLCRFHTFFESLFSSCIIFYHLLGALDRFVYIHGHTASDTSPWSNWCRRFSTKSGSIILLTLPLLCSIPIAVCNLLHAHVLSTSLSMKTCVIQYTHGTLISFLIFFYIAPLLFAFFLHGKLIYFIRSKHHRHYLTATSYVLPTRRNTVSESQLLGHKKRRLYSQSTLMNNQQLLQPRSFSEKAGNRHVVMINTNTVANLPGTGVTTTTLGSLRQAGANNSSNSSASSRSSLATSLASVASPIIFYKINSQANANAKRTILLLVLLLSFYVLCWAPYNIYTWRRAYQLTTNNDDASSLNRPGPAELNQTLTPSVDNLHGDLRRIIFINYFLYLLSMISMCFSFIFYFSLNKQARQELSNIIGCICPWSIDQRKGKQKRKPLKQENGVVSRLQYHPRYQYHHAQKNQLALLSVHANNQRVATTKFNTHPTIVPPIALITDRQNKKKSLTHVPQVKMDSALSKRPVMNYGCHVQCCP